MAKNKFNKFKPQQQQQLESPPVSKATADMETVVEKLMKKKQQTQTCNFFLQGKCIHGDKCNYKHEGEPVKSDAKPSAKIQTDSICTFYMQGKCSKDECRFAHPTEKECEEMVGRMMRDPNFNSFEGALTTKKKTLDLSRVAQRQKEEPFQSKKSHLEPVKKVEEPARPVPQAFRKETVSIGSSDPDQIEQVNAIQVKIHELRELSKLSLARSGPYSDKARCTAMCSPEEFAERTGEHRGLSHFEQPNPKNPANLLHSTDLAVKEFKKSAAGEILNMRERVRPPCVQRATMNYLRDCICDQDRVPEGKSVYKYAAEDQNSHSFLDIYGFVHNRVR